MTSASEPELSTALRFPGFTEVGDLNSLSIVAQDLSLTYDIVAVAILPGYERVPMPTTRFGPRRWSELSAEDRLPVKRISFSSPLEMIFGIGGAIIGGAATANNRILIALKGWTDFLAAGQDRRERRQALEESRAMAPERLREIQLTNALKEQHLRRATVEADLMEHARDEILRPQIANVGEVNRANPPRQQRRARDLTVEDYVELLDDPMRRILYFGGGELEIEDDESGQD